MVLPAAESLAQRGEERRGKAWPWGLYKQSDEGVFLLDSAVLPHEASWVSAGLMAYWWNEADESLYVYDALIFERAGIVPALAALEDDLGVDVRRLAAGIDWLERPEKEADRAARQEGGQCPPYGLAF